MASEEAGFRVLFMGVCFKKRVRKWKKVSVLKKG
jgi:hypothetical protein